MLSLAFTEKSLEVQRSVVIEEFKQRYLNQPYGDVWLHLRPLVYEKHPYQWATIGKDISHIENATMKDVKAFFKTFYTPSNAILCISGNFNKDLIHGQIENYFGDIPGNPKPKRPDFIEPKQEKYKSKDVYRDVPAGAFYYAFKMGSRKSKDYYLGDLMSDAIGKDNSSLLNIKLKKELDLVSEINAFITGSIDCGLFIISGKLSKDVTFEKLDEQLWSALNEIKKSGVGTPKLKALKNKIRTAKAFQEQGLLNRSINLVYFELLGDAHEMNKEENKYQEIENTDLGLFAKKCFVKTNCSLLKVHQDDSKN
jgi:predicted Zn-dependent peptidase